VDLEQVIHHGQFHALRIIRTGAQSYPPMNSSWEDSCKTIDISKVGEKVHYKNEATIKLSSVWLVEKSLHHHHVMGSYPDEILSVNGCITC
jgi:hypothetical protein